MVIEVVEDLSNIVTEVVFAPVFVIAMIPVRFSRRVHGYFLAEGERKGFVPLDLINEPDRDPVSAELF